jgi:hypothetical protein
MAAVRSVAGRGPLPAVAGALVAAVVVAVLAVTLGGGDAGAMGAGDAAEFAERALADAGVEATVGEPTAGSFDGPSGAEDVWVVPAAVDGRQIALSVDADGDRALNLADGLGNGTNVLDDEAFDALAAFRYDPLAQASTVPSVVALAAVLVAGGLLVWAVRAGRAAAPAR